MRQVGVTAIEFSSGAHTPHWMSPSYPFVAYPYTYAVRPNDGPPTLSFGQGGPWVTYLQGKLGVPVTGVMDVRTVAAVRTVQASTGLAPTGIVDVSTWRVVLALPFGFSVLADPYGSYDPYAGGYMGYPYPYLVPSLWGRGGGGMFMASSRNSTPGRGGSGR